MWKTILPAAFAVVVLAACGEDVKAKAAAPAAPAAQSAPEAAPAADEEKKEAGESRPEGDKPDGEQKDQ